MDLSSAKDKILLKNCIVVHLQQLELEKNKPNSNYLARLIDINYLKKLNRLLKADDIDKLTAILKNNQNYADFNQHILSTPAKEIAKEYINLSKLIMEETNTYSDEKFDELKRAFYKGNEDLMTTSSYQSLEEEPQEQPVSKYLNNDIKACLSDFDNLFKTTKNMVSKQFQEFCHTFRDLTKRLGKLKLQQFYDKSNQTITDMEISDTVVNNKPIYEIALTLEDSDQNKTNTTLRTKASSSGFISNYQQNLCYGYLEANKYYSADTSLIDENLIPAKMKDFSNCYENMKNMAICKVSVLPNNTLITSMVSTNKPSGEFSISPQKSELEER